MDVANKTAFIVTPGKWLSGKTATIICLITAFAFKIILTVVTYAFTADLLRQGLAGRNFAEGHGLTLEQVHAEDLSTIVNNPLVGWPPAYSISVIPFYWLFHKDIVFACLFTACLYGTLFIIITWLLLRRLAFPAHIINLFILFLGLNIPEYMHISSATDLPALICCIWACYQLVVLIQNNKKPMYGIGMGIVSALGAWFRYMYIPVCFVIPCLLLWIGYKQKNKRLSGAGLYAFASTLLLIAGLMVFQQSYTGNSLYIKNTSKGFFPENLTYAYPFVLNTFADVHFLIVQFHFITGIEYDKCIEIIRALGGMLFLVLLYPCAHFIIRSGKRIANAQQIYLSATGLISITSIAILFYLSLTISDYYDFPDNISWTYCAEGRYYAFPIFSIQVLILWWLYKRATNKVRTLNVFRIVFIILLSANMLQGLYRVNKFTREYQQTKSAIFWKKAKTFIQQIKDEGKQQQSDVVVASPDVTMSGLATLEGVKTLYNAEELITKNIHVTKKTLLVLLIRDKHITYFAGFIKSNHATELQKMEGFRIFSCYISPA